jgi:hypothetical protein
MKKQYCLVCGARIFDKKKKDGSIGPWCTCHYPLRSDFHFQVLDEMEILPGYYMTKDGQEVPWDGSDQSHLIIHQRLTLRECKKQGIIDKYDEV